MYKEGKVYAPQATEGLWNVGLKNLWSNSQNHLAIYVKSHWKCCILSGGCLKKKLPVKKVKNIWKLKTSEILWKFIDKFIGVSYTQQSIFTCKLRSKWCYQIFFRCSLKYFDELEQFMTLLNILNLWKLHLSTTRM